MKQLIALAVMLLLSAGVASAQCCGDCDSNNVTTATELDTCTALLVSQDTGDPCFDACDCDDDEEITVTDITNAAIAHSSGCPGAPTTTPSRTFTLTPTITLTRTPTPTPTPGAFACCQDHILGIPVCVAPPPTGTPGTYTCMGAQVIGDAVCELAGHGSVGYCVTRTPTPQLSSTPTRTPTRTPVKTATPTYTGTPPAAACLGPATCTEEGTFTQNIQLCLPAEGDANWHAALNSNADLIDSMFPGCALAPAYGGTGSRDIPQQGDILVGGTDLVYHRLPAGIDGTVLTVDPSADLGVAYKPPAPASDGPPDAGLCDDTTRGLMRTDGVNHKLWICNGTARGWDFVLLQPSCCGDCNNDNAVSPAEIAVCTEIALMTQPLGVCPQCDCDRSGVVTSDEITLITIYSLSACPGYPTPTPTP